MAVAKIIVRMYANNTSIILGNWLAGSSVLCEQYKGYVQTHLHVVFLRSSETAALFDVHSIQGYESGQVIHHEY